MHCFSCRGRCRLPGRIARAVWADAPHSVESNGGRDAAPRHRAPSRMTTRRLAQMPDHAATHVSREALGATSRTSSGAHIGTSNLRVRRTHPSRSPPRPREPLPARRIKPLDQRRARQRRALPRRRLLLHPRTVDLSGEVPAQLIPGRIQVVRGPAAAHRHLPGLARQRRTPPQQRHLDRHALRFVRRQRICVRQPAGPQVARRGEVALFLRESLT